MFRLLSLRKAVPVRVSITQALVAANVLAVERTLAAALRTPQPPVMLDLSQVHEYDTAGATLLHAFIAVVEDGGGSLQIHAAHPGILAAVQAVASQPAQHVSS